MYTPETGIYYTIVIGTLTLTSTVTIYMIQVLRAHRNKILSYKDKIATESSFAELERSRIAADLHDDLGSFLAAIKIYLEYIEPFGDREKENIETTGGFIDNAMVKIREISNNLMPKSLRYNNFFIAAREYCAFIGISTKVNVRFHCTDDTYVIPSKSGIHLYRIMQEIITNAIRHGRPTYIDVSITVNNGFLEIIIKDNGKGFDQTITQKEAGSGLYNIITRVHLLEGKVYLDTSPGNGTLYTIKIPV